MKKRDLGMEGGRAVEVQHFNATQQTPHTVIIAVLPACTTSLLLKRTTKK
jgi:hypothetical protein